MVLSVWCTFRTCEWGCLQKHLYPTQPSSRGSQEETEFMTGTWLSVYLFINFEMCLFISSSFNTHFFLAYAKSEILVLKIQNKKSRSWPQRAYTLVEKANKPTNDMRTEQKGYSKGQPTNTALDSHTGVRKVPQPGYCDLNLEGQVGGSYMHSIHSGAG